jgi:glycosyltransferase involved in cell wall biosynthesis
MAPGQGPRHAVLAFAAVRKKCQDAKLVCAGTGIEQDNADLVSLLDDAGIRDGVTLAGPVNSVRPLLRTSRALVLSSSYGEALPISGIEALAEATPVIATEVGDCPRLLIDSRQCVPPSSPDRLGAAMQWMLNLDEAASRDLSTKSYELARKSFWIISTVDAYAKIYQRAKTSVA